MLVFLPKRGNLHLLVSPLVYFIESFGKYLFAIWLMSLHLLNHLKLKMINSILLIYLFHLNP